MRNVEKKVTNLTNLAKDGNNDAKDKLLEQNIDFIIKIANKTYNQIKRKYMIYNNIDVKFEDYNLPNNLINKDDVVQDFYILSINLLNKYLRKDQKKYFSEYLNNSLQFHSQKYINNTLQKLINTEENEFHLIVDDLFKKIKEQFIAEEEKKHIIETVKNDKVLEKYLSFVNLVLDGHTYDEIKLETNLDNRRINMKINQFASLYAKKNHRVIFRQEIQEKIRYNEYIDFLSQNYSPEEIEIIREEQVKAIISEIKNGKKNLINNLIYYYTDFIDDLAHIVYNKYNEYFPNNRTFEDILQDFYSNANRLIFNYFKKDNHLDRFNHDFQLKLKYYKNTYLYKLKQMNMEDKNDDILQKKYTRK